MMNETLMFRQRIHQIQFNTIADHLPNTHANVIPASVTPNVEWHFKSDDKYTHTNFFSTFPEGMGSQELVKATFPGIIVRRVVMIGTFTFSHLDWLIEALKVNETYSHILQSADVFYLIAEATVVKDLNKELGEHKKYSMTFYCSSIWIQVYITLMSYML